jgi:hypothetical protein
MALAENRKNIETLNKYIDRLKAVQKQLEGIEKGTSEYNKKLIQKNKLEEKAAKTSKKLAESQGRLENTLPKHRKLIQQAADAQKRYSAATQKSTKSNTGFFGSLGKTIKTLSRLGIAYKIIQGGTALLNELFVKSAKRAIAFEKAMAELRAVAALTKEELASLENVVFEVAGTTSFTAIQIAELQKQLGKLGSSAEEIGQLTKPVALLAQALGEEPGGVAEALKKALNQFNQTAAEASRFSNVIVGAVNESALTLTDLGTALQYVGPLASQVGLTFDETATFLGLLTNNGLKASRAGTGLRRVLSEAAKEGIPFKNFIEQLAKNNLDAAEAFEIFGQRGAGAAVILADTINEFDDLNAEVNDSTRLLRANAVQMSSTQGQIDLLSSAYNKASISIGNYITQTEFFIELIERLDPRIAGQARAFKFLSNASEQGEKSFDDLTTSLIQFNTTQKEQEAGSEALFQILREGGDLTSMQLKIVEKQFKAQKKLNPQLRLSEFLQTKSNGSMKDAGRFLDELIKMSVERAKVLREQRILELATNEQYGAAVEMTQKLVATAKEGVMTDEESLRVTKGLESELTRLQNTRENQRGLSIEEITVLEKRIALFEDLLASVRNLENSEAAIAKNKETRTKEEQKRLKDELKDAIEAIKEQERLIKEDLVEGISDKQFLLQVDLLTALFGNAEDIISEAEKLYGENSQFVKDLKKVFQGAAEEVSVGLPKAAKSTMDLTTKSLLETINFIKKNKDLFSFEDVIIDALVKTADAIDDFSEVRQENYENQEKARLESVKRNADIESDILRSQLDNQLITESQFKSKQLELQRAQLAKENAINKKIFESQKKQERTDATTDLAVALASIIPNMFKRGEAGEPVTTALKAKISAALAVASFGAEIAAINSRQFVPKRFAEGGMVNGPSHAEGGVPFSVQGQGGYEMEGGEFIVNKRATAMHKGLLEKINDSYRTRPMSGKHMFANGGLVTAQANESVDYLKAIAEATTSTAIQASKPMRAFVSSKDLRSNDTERRLRDRNDRI